MKCAKSRNSKNSRSCVRVARHRRPGGARPARDDDPGEAEPTWWTCSSALGRPAMNVVEGHAGDCAVGMRLAGRELLEPVGQVLDRAPVERLAVDEHRRRAVAPRPSRRTSGPRAKNAGVRRARARRAPSGRSRRPCRRQRPQRRDAGLVRGLLGGLVLVEQVVELQRLRRRAAAAAPRPRRRGRARSSRSRQQLERRGTRPAPCPSRRPGWRKSRVDGLELPAERAQEVLVDDHLDRGAPRRRRPREWSPTCAAGVRAAAGSPVVLLPDVTHDRRSRSRPPAAPGSAVGDRSPPCSRIAAGARSGVDAGMVLLGHRRARGRGNSRLSRA